MFNQSLVTRAALKALTKVLQHTQQAASQLSSFALGILSKIRLYKAGTGQASVIVPWLSSVTAVCVSIAWKAKNYAIQQINVDFLEV